jgi:hypothetical protein
MTITIGATCQLALLDSGVLGQGQIPSAEDSNNAFVRANMMLAQWNRKRWLVYALSDVAFASTGAESYTVGTGGNFNIARPDRLEDGCYMRQLTNTQQVDYPMRLLPSHEDYTRIRLKSMGTFPQVVFYDSAYPLANVFFWPVPQNALYELHILVKTPLAPFTQLAETVLLPDEYQAALLYNLQVRLRAAYRLPADPVVVALAKDSLNIIRNANAQIPLLRMPRAVMGNGSGYNVYSDGN